MQNYFKGKDNMRNEIGRIVIAGGILFLMIISDSLKMSTISFSSAILYTVISLVIILLGFNLLKVRIEKEPHNAANIEKLK